MFPNTLVGPISHRLSLRFILDVIIQSVGRGDLSSFLNLYIFLNLLKHHYYNSSKGRVLRSTRIRLQRLLLYTREGGQRGGGTGMH